MNERMNEWMNEQIKRMNEWTNKTNEWMNERMNEWMNERTKKYSLLNQAVT